MVTLQGPTKRIACHGTEIGFYLHQSKGVDWVFVDHPSYPRPGGIYADQYGVYGDNQVCPYHATALHLLLFCALASHCTAPEKVTRSKQSTRMPLLKLKHLLFV